MEYHDKEKFIEHLRKLFGDKFSQSMIQVERVIDGEESPPEMVVVLRFPVDILSEQCGEE